MLKRLLAILMIVSASWQVSALTNGTMQNEFASFEPSDASDLVNLATGDFTYVLPLGEVNDPSGVGYPITLSYHAGILNEQEASWVGLGWSLNVGSINRAIRGFPDDCAGDIYTQYLAQGDYGYGFGVGVGVGFSATSNVLNLSASVGFSYKASSGNWKFDGVALGAQIGPKNSPLTFSANMTLFGGKNTFSVGAGFAQKFGSIGTEVGFRLGPDGASVSGNADIGITDRKTGGFNTIGGYGISSSGGPGNIKVGSYASVSSMQGSSDALSQSSFGLSVGIPVLPFLSLMFSYNQWEWTYWQMEYGNAYGYLFSSIDKNSRGLSTSNPVLTLATGNGKSDFQEITFGLAKKKPKSSTTVINEEGIVASEPGNVNVVQVAPKLECINGGDINLPSQDIYSMTGQGIGGVFQPISYNSLRTCYSDDPKFDGGIGKVTSGTGTVADPFVYANGYFNSSETRFSSNFKDGMQFKMLGDHALNLIDNCDVDYSFKDQMQNIDLEKDIENVVKKVTAYGTKIEPLFGMERRFPGKLSGFVVTDQQGKSYYYTKPLFLLQQVSYINNEAKPPLRSNKVFSMEKSGSHSYSIMNSPYATTWLLTAVTGPDYVKMTYDEDWSKEEKIKPHKGDIGYWVNFHYEYGDIIEEASPGNLATIPESANSNQEGKVTYRWRTPYYDSNTPDPLPHVKNPQARNGSDTYISTFGQKEITYLKAIETPSEIAYFRTSPRLDGMGVDNESYPNFPPQPILSTLASINTKIIKEISPNVSERYPDRSRINMIPDVSGHISNLNNCLTVDIDAAKFGLEKLEQLPDGTSLLRLQISAKAVYKSTFNWGNEPHTRVKPAKGALIVVKDTYGCKNNSGEFIGISQEMDPDRVYADEYSTTTEGTENGEELKSAKYTSFAKCFYWEKLAGQNTIRLYITGFKCLDIMPGFIDMNTPKTAIDMGKSSFWYQWNEYKLNKYTEINVESAWIDGALGCYDAINPITRYQKKLTEIAWYSKSEYPSLSLTIDPEDQASLTSEDKPNPYPASYRRVKLDYNYENAFGTTNSMLENGSMGGGRLTLKKLWFEGGKGSNSTATPPYAFEYQGSRIVPYNGFERSDPWGFHNYEQNDFLDMPYEKGVGVNWNLERITYPSGGEMEILFERDFAVTGLATLYKMRYDENKLEKQPDDKHLFYQGDYYFHKTVAGIDETRKEITLNSVNDLQAGMYLVVRYDENTTEVVVDREFPDSYRCVDKGENWYCPEPCAYCEANPRYWQIGTYAISYHTEKYRYLYRISEVVAAANKIILKDPLPGISEVPKEIFALKNTLLYCDGLRVTKITSKSDGISLNTFYQYPQQGGVLGALPDNAIPVDLLKKSSFSRVTERYGCTYDPNADDGRVYFCEDGAEYHGERALDYMPYSADISKNYGSGNIGVIYPTVTVYKGKTDGTKIDGSKRYNFWTSEDNVLINNEMVPLVQHKEFEGGKQILDRSSIIGQVKSTEILDKNEKVISYVKNHYAFGGDLPSKSAVFHTAFDKKLTAEKPLGTVKQRSIRVNKDGENGKILDLVTQVPYLINVETFENGNIRETKSAMFDARTGTPMATIEKNSNEQEVRLSLTAPFHYLANKETIQKLKNKNLFSLLGGSLTANIHRASPGQTPSPSEVDYAKIIEPFDSIKIAGAQEYYCSIIKNDILPYDQDRFYAFRDYKWNGKGAFAWPGENKTNWLKLSEIVEVDDWLRPKTVNNVINVPSTTIQHPDKNCIIGIVTNASFKECGVFTGDYQATKDPATWWDYQNGWEKGVVHPPVLVNDKAHFGKKVIKVTQDYAAGRNFMITPGKAYTFSAWVKVTNGTVALMADMRGVNNASKKSWPLIWSSDLNAPLENIGTLKTELSFNPAKEPSWVHLTLEIPKALTELLDPTTAWCIRACIGNHPDAPTFTAYIDDIRFGPKDAQILSNYYNHEFDQIILTVDANNHPGHRTSYDNLGRPVLVEKINEQMDASNNGFETKLQSKKYHTFFQLGNNENIKLTAPEGKKFNVNDKIKVQWIQKNDGAVVLLYRKFNETSGGTSIPVRAWYPSGVNSVEWQVPEITDLIPRKMVISHSDNSTDESDEPFIIKTSPNEPNTPFPVPGSRVLTTIKNAWSGGDLDNDNVTYTIYRGTESGQMSEIARELLTPEFRFTDLVANSHYFWKVVATDADHQSTISPIWDFTAISQLDRFVEVSALQYDVNGDFKWQPIFTNWFVPGTTVTTAIGGLVETIPCSEGSPPTLLRFIGWNTNGLQITPTTSPDFRFIMPDDDVVIRAIYEGNCIP